MGGHVIRFKGGDRAGWAGLARPAVIFICLVLFVLAASRAFAQGVVSEEVIGRLLNKTLKSIPKTIWAELERKATFSEKEALFRRHVAAAFSRNLIQAMGDDVFQVMKQYLEKPGRIGQFLEKNPQFFKTLNAEVQKAVFQFSQQLEVQKVSPCEEFLSFLVPADGIPEIETLKLKSPPIPLLFTNETINFLRAIEEHVLEDEKFALLEPVFPEFKISYELLRKNPREWFSMLMEDGRFTLDFKKTVKAPGAEHLQYYSEAGGGVEAVMSTMDDTLKIELTFSQKLQNVKCYFRYEILYVKEMLHRWRIFQDDSLMWEGREYGK